LDLDLSAKLAKLSPFGPQNPTLILASRNLTLSHFAKIGKNKEHLRLTVKDKEGNAQSILWWRADKEDLPPKGSKFDLAFKMRTGEYKGSPQLTLEMVGFRITEEIKEEETKQEIEVLRLDVETFDKLRTAGLQIFVEGKSEFKGKNRYELEKADELVVYTSPPSAKAWREILKKIQPKKIYLLGTNPPEVTVQDFLAQLAGLMKYTLAKKDGQTTISALATVTAQRETTIRLGLEWLAAGGQVVDDV